MCGQNYGIIRIICVIAIRSIILLVEFSRAVCRGNIDKTRGHSVRNFSVTVETDLARARVRKISSTVTRLDASRAFPS